MRIAIVGHEAAKFDKESEREAKDYIRSILSPGDVVVSGRCPLGGIDVWAEEIAAELGLETDIYPPASNDWTFGFKPRNIKIAEHCDVIVCIVVDCLPGGYKGRRFPMCYHCKTDQHVKSGGRWTALYAQRVCGVPATWVVIEQIPF